MRRRKIWVGLGTAVLAAAPVAAIAASETGRIHAPAMSTAQGQDGSVTIAQHAGHGPVAQAPAGADGEGEGGGGAELPAGLSFYRDLGLIRGHLQIGGELVEAGRWADALPHFLHPQEEIYAGMREHLKTFEVAPFQTALMALTQTVKAKNKDAYARARAALEERLAAADAKVRAKEANAAYFTLEAVLEILQVAAEEYEAAIGKGGRIANLVEYQDARGFVFESERLVNGVASQLSAKDADAVKKIQAGLADLKTIFPTAVPPKQAVKDAGQFLSDVSTLELQLGKLR
jgi:hypothetical protein